MRIMLKFWVTAFITTAVFVFVAKLLVAIMLIATVVMIVARAV